MTSQLSILEILQEIPVIAQVVTQVIVQTVTQIVNPEVIQLIVPETAIRNSKGGKL